MVDKDTLAVRQWKNPQLTCLGTLNKVVQSGAGKGSIELDGKAGGNTEFKPHNN